MSTKFLVPRLGEGVDEVTIVKWLKREGEPVKELEPMVEVETDKVVTEIPSPASGVVLKIAIPENTPARVGEVMAWIGEAGETVGARAEGETTVSAVSAPAAPRPEPGKPEPSPVSEPREAPFLSPIVRKLAAEYGVDLSQVRGTGLGGRITRQDVVEFIEKREKSVERSGEESREQRGESSEVRKRGESSGEEQRRGAEAAPGVVPAAGDQLIRHSTVRKQIAERMVASKRISPHVLTVMEADLSRVVAHRTANKVAFEREGVNLTFTAYFVSAIVAALKANPLVNSTWTDEGLLLHRDINIGMATSLGEEGLIVPVIKNADHLSLLGIARAVNDLAARARSKKLTPDEVKGATFTLTNHGTAGSLFAMPIINQPQCGILGTGAIQKRPVVVTDAEGNDSIAIRPMVYLSFVFDHRILDGASADAFLAKVKERLERWS
jgi:2-oxoglutarate dehydrogenase E2 component (dihydrolipoamide succinyltransferase)